MRMMIILPAIFLLFYSCATSEIDKQTADIKNEDFKAPKRINYHPSRDYYKSTLMNSDALGAETLAKAMASGKEKGEIKGDKLASAVQFCYKGEFAKAKEVFDSLYRSYHKNPSYWNQVGTCFCRQKQYAKANLYYLKALDYRKSYVPAINNIGVIYWLQNDEQKALAAFKKAIKAAPQARTPRYNLSQVYLKFGLTSEARRHLSFLYKRNSKDADVIAAIGTSYLMDGSLKHSLQYFSKLPEKSWEDGTVSLNYAVLLKLLGRKDEAEDVFEEIETATVKGMRGYYKKVKKLIGR